MGILTVHYCRYCVTDLGTHILGLLPGATSQKPGVGPSGLWQPLWEGTGHFQELERGGPKALFPVPLGQRSSVVLPIY